MSAAVLDRRVRAALIARPELAELVLRMAEPPPVKVTTALDAVALFAPLLAGQENEALAVAAIDRRSRVVEVAILTRGAHDYALVDPRQVLRWVLTRIRPASGFILAHNHPSGDPEPSSPDVVATGKVREAAAAVGLDLLDHVIVCSPVCWVSMAARSLL